MKNYMDVLQIALKRAREAEKEFNKENVSFITGYQSMAQDLKDYYFEHYAVIPAHVELAMRQKGINIYNPAQTKEVLKEINTNYPHLKTTNRTHG